MAIRVITVIMVIMVIRDILVIRVIVVIMVIIAIRVITVINVIMVFTTRCISFVVKFRHADLKRHSPFEVTSAIIACRVNDLQSLYSSYRLICGRPLTKACSEAITTRGEAVKRLGFTAIGQCGCSA
ncbi:hypothetical protein CAPTEDRAFT_213548 [Capitella teleta]|uniref:Uncharacterized protein n=1 Tax=Capitella teleta TaxID=283909 RepID=R7TA59_CAPTE|nr:hypothetical protein CAPTEDRAFT_213548 [Capitella teleta]|eukprot:ELT88270.1 hypothetical protein CAPTEDRAFT_213548 [Capitella teleta]